MKKVSKKLHKQAAGKPKKKAKKAVRSTSGKHKPGLLAAPPRGMAEAVAISNHVSRRAGLVAFIAAMNRDNAAKEGFTLSCEAGLIAQLDANDATLMRMAAIAALAPEIDKIDTALLGMGFKVETTAQPVPAQKVPAGG